MRKYLQLRMRRSMQQTMESPRLDQLGDSLGVIYTEFVRSRHYLERQINSILNEYEHYLSEEIDEAKQCVTQASKSSFSSGNSHSASLCQNASRIKTNSKQVQPKEQTLNFDSGASISLESSESSTSSVPSIAELNLSKISLHETLFLTPPVPESTIKETQVADEDDYSPQVMGINP